MKAVCDRHGALFMYDEIMCGLGRSGTRHAWQAEGTPPDIEIVGKTLGSGYASISAILINEKVIEALRRGSGCFTHGQTFQNLPVSCAAALEVQRIIQEDNLVANVARMGALLSSLLHARFDTHPYVGDIRGRGLFWCTEFVADRATKAPFPAAFNLAKRMANRGLEPGYDISLFAANGSADGWLGDHFLLCPPYNISEGDVEEIVKRVVKVVESVFKDIKREGLLKGMVDSLSEGEKGEALPNGAGPNDVLTSGGGPDDKLLNGINGISCTGAIERSQGAPIVA
jgi:adenosylmethionine-8-amino-7-oxononanoate aminotransferase